MRRPSRRTLAALGLALALAALAFVALARRSPAPRPIVAADFAGEGACLSCHAAQAAFRGTAHHLSSRAPTREAIAGSFAPGENLMRTSNPYLHFRMEEAPRGFYQTAVSGPPQATSTRSERFGMVIGSGRKGQTYLYWSGDRLFQLPVSYWTELDRWVNSPGYPEGLANFERPVLPRCLECHATHVQALPGPEPENRYDTTRISLGISCEKCHGPGREHVERQRSPLRRLRGSGLVNPADLSRRRQVEGCALCHGGIGRPQRPAFTYRPGEPLEDYLLLPAPEPGAEIDVHGNQVALLERSPCFQGSEMTCSTCHDVHRPQRSVAELSGRCLGCHTPRSCGLFPERGAALAGKCVDCHMPALPTNTIVSSVDGRMARPRVRTHWIRVYRELRDAAR